MAGQGMLRELTGRHAALLIGGGFALVVGVNLLMAVLASSTFSGSVVRNGYVASQNFNRWLEVGRVQAGLGWAPDAVIADGALRIRVTGADGGPVTGLLASARLSHPLWAGGEEVVPLRETEPGVYSGPVKGHGAMDAAVVLEDGARRFLFTRRLVAGG
jgi:nitrogen fixation protein FixH